MTTLVGVLLLLVFLVFATLMFLERISTLLALPLMAASFLLIALTADCFGADPRSGLQDWIRARERAAALLRNRAELLTTIESSPRAAVAERIAAARARELGLLDAGHLPDIFRQPPHISGYAERILHELRTPDLSAAETQIRAALAAGDEARLAAQVRLLQAGLARTPPPPSPSRGAAIVMYFAGYLETLLRGGSLKLAAAIIATIFGGMFALYVKNLGIAERVIYWAAEFAGERPFVIALAVFTATAVIFTSVGGLGTVIMLGSITLPVLRSVGLSPVVGAGVLLMAIAAGGTINPVSRRLWLDFYRLPPAQLDAILWTMLLLYVALALVWIAWGARRSLLSSFDAEVAPKESPSQPMSLALLTTPLIPVALVYFARVEEISAFVFALLFMFLCVCRRPGAVRLLTRSLIEGAQTVMPPVLLMIGIGMLITALEAPTVQGYLRPLIAAAAPTERWSYILLFGLAAPLALYRGPLNVWGMGLALSSTLLTTTDLPPAAILGALLAAGMLQGISDPTNTANVWVAGFCGISTAQLLRYTFLPVWLAALVAVVLFGVWYVA